MTISSPEIAPPPVPEERMGVWFVGNRSALFWLALKAGFWTVLTLGFYRFWMKTRLRRWYWSSIRPGGYPLEYVGDPWEKLLGFFIAVVILTFYIGIVNLLLMFASFSLFQSSFVGYAASFMGVIPVWFYAQYRARRYVLGRTRWRAVRFGLEKGAWGYAWRALVHWMITICTAGLLWPRMTFWLEKYKTDRTYFGSAKLVQGGRWPMLYRAATPFIFAVAILAGLAGWVIWLDPLLPLGTEPFWEVFENLDGLWDEDIDFLDSNKPSRLFLSIPAIALLGYGMIHYRFASKRILASHKHALGMRMKSELNSARVSMIYVLGATIAYLVLIIGVGIIAIAAAMLFVPDDFLSTVSLYDRMMGSIPRWLSFAVLGALYLSVFLLWGVLYHVFVTFPLMRHMAITLSLHDVKGLSQISQRARDEFAEAEGFAEALDLGAAI
ncbi:MAG: DUF898 family protein [Sulfitobacter sp.]